MMPSVQIYVKKDFIYAVPLAKVPAGYFVGIEPVKKVAIKNKPGFVVDITVLMRRDDKVVPTPSVNANAVVLRYSNCKTWRQFAKDCMEYSLDKIGNAWQVTPYKQRSDRGTEEDLTAKVTLDESYSEDHVAEELYEILITR